PYPGPDVDRGPRVAATYIIGCSIATVFVILRLYSRVSIGAIGADDWCMLATATANIPLTVLTSLLALNGGTRHFYYLLQDPGKAMFVTKLNWLTQAFAVFCMSVGKIAIALLIIRLLDRASRWRKWFLYFSSAWLMINCLLMITINFAQCKDVRALWNPVIKATTRCWDPSIQENFALYAGSKYSTMPFRINTAMDFFLAILPVTIVWNLKLNTLKRIGLVVLLGCGIITGIASAVKTSMLSTLSSRADITWETYSLFIWTGVEIALIIVCGCVPPLRALYTKYRGPQTTKVSSYYANSG
ncbi:hypothetical protein CC78DRAFT_423481, partial [Lojkania enalia]